MSGPGTSGPGTSGPAVSGPAVSGRQGLVIDHLTLRFGGLEALSDVSLRIAPGTLYSVIGPNGAGKTSLFNCLTGYYRPTSGSVVYGGVDITTRGSADVAALGIRRTFQNIRLFPRLTAAENVLAGAHLRSRSNVLGILLAGPRHRKAERALADEAAQWLAFVGLERYAGERAGELPYGVRKRMEVARALIGQPSMLLLDEPAAGVSSVERDELSDLIRRVSERGVTVVMIEHDVELVMRLATEVAVLDHGRLIAQGPPAEVRRDEAVVRAYMGRKRR
ncbi:MAG: ABC transporter ATP-binding protein [Acidimicrobiales bacterium]